MIAVSAFFLLYAPAKAEAPTYSPEALKLVQDESLSNKWVEALIWCESSNRPNIKVLDTNGYYSYGAAQFQLSTWLSYGKQFGATRENIYDGDLQRMVVTDMLSKGLKDHWFTCSRRVEKLLGSYPVPSDESSYIQSK